MANKDGYITGAVSQTDIKKVLGIDTNSLAAACLSDKINPKAAYKPDSTLSLLPITEQQRKNNNYSIAISIYNNPILLLRDCVSEIAYLYNRPNANFRRLDFKGYNHNATDWITIAADTIYINRVCPVELSGNGEATAVGLEGLLSLMEMGYLSDVSEQSLQFGFLIKNSTITSGIRNCLWVPVTGMQTIRDIVGNDKLSIPANVFSEPGEWQILPCFSTATFPQNSINTVTLDTMNGQWFPIPFCKILSINVKNETIIYPVDLIAIYLESANISITEDGFVTVSNIKIAIDNANNTDCRVVISSAKISNGVIGSAINLAGGSINVAAESSAVLNIQSSAVQFEVADPSIERISINLEYYLDQNLEQRRNDLVYIDIY